MDRYCAYLTDQPVLFLVSSMWKEKNN